MSKIHKLDTYFDKYSNDGLSGLCGQLWISAEKTSRKWDLVTCKRCLKLKEKEIEIYEKREKDIIKLKRDFKYNRVLE